MKIRFKHVFFAMAAVAGAYVLWQLGSVIFFGFRILDETSKTIVSLTDEATAAVAAEWDPPALAPFASQDYLATLEQQDQLDTWHFYHSLGKATLTGPCTVTSAQIQDGRGNAQVTCPIAFETVKAQVIYKLTNYSDDWQSNLAGEWKIQSLSLLI